MPSMGIQGMGPRRTPEIKHQTSIKGGGAERPAEPRAPNGIRGSVGAMVTKDQVGA